MYRKLKVFFICVLVTVILFFFIQFAYKTFLTGKNISKSSDDLIEYILNCSSYEAKLNVIIQSNKTKNQYYLQQYYLEPNFAKQIVIEPTNIENLETIYNGSCLIIRNTNLGLSKIYENYPYLNENILWLNCFVPKDKNQWHVTENQKEIMISTNSNPYNYQKNLYINKETSLPTKMEIIDNSNQTKVYIEYKEIRLNTIRENNIFAFQTKVIKEEV